MLTRASAALTGLVGAALLTAWSMGGTLSAQKTSVPKAQDKVALAEDDVKRLLLLMDTDKNGKISKQQFMRFMEAEFTRLDKNKDGQLDVKELTTTKLRSLPPSIAAIK